MNSSTFSFKTITALLRGGRWPAAGLAAAVVVAVIELLVALLPHPAYKDFVRHRFYNPHVKPGVAESVVQWQVAHATLLGEKQDLLLLGDSACLCNLDAELLMEETGLKTWNLGTFGFTYTTGHSDILRLFIEHNGPPRFLVYHTSHEPLTASRGKRAVRSWVGRLREWMAPPETVDYLFPSLRHRQELRNTILALGKESVPYTGLNLPRGDFASDDEVRQELWEKRGTLLPKPRAVDSGERFQGKIVWGPRFHPDCVNGLERIFETAREYGFPILILFNPLPEQADNKIVKKAMDALETNLEETIRPYPWVSIYQPFLRFYPNDFCSDMRHLTLKGARRHTEELAEWIRANWTQLEKDFELENHKSQITNTK